MNTNNQNVQIAAIAGIVLIVLALIAAKVFAPQESGINDLLTLIGGIVTVLLGLAKLQSIGNGVTEAKTAIVQTNAAVAESNVKQAEMHDQLKDLHKDVNGLNAAALLDRGEVEHAKGVAAGDAAGFERGVAVGQNDPPLDTTNPRTQLPARPTTEQQIYPRGKT